MRRTALTAGATLILALAAMSACATVQKKGTNAAEAFETAQMPQRIWQDLGDPASLDLMHGAGGRGHAPDPTGAFTFVSEDALATSPKFDVVDGQGVEWKVKLGQESKAETAATRFLWAAGYFVDEDYYLAELKVKGLPPLQRGRQFTSSDGTVRGARLERKRTTVRKLGDWDWADNPFLGQRELNGLRVMMSLLNNWDLKQVNNSVYVVDGERHYVVSDVGATFGKTGNQLSRSKGVPSDYRDSRFIGTVTPDSVNLVLHSRPFFLWAVALSKYRERAGMDKITRHIPRADAKWLGQRLSLLTDEQIRDGFRAGGYDAGHLEMLTKTMRARMTALGAL